MVAFMPARREQRGSCLIEVDALDLQHGSHWRPWLRLTRCAGGACASRTFDRLKPVFASEQAALRYAAALGRSLADEESALGPESRKPGPAAWLRYQALARLCAWRLRAQAFSCAIVSVMR